MMKILKTVKEWSEEHEVTLYNADIILSDPKPVSLKEFANISAKYKTRWRNPHKNGFTMMKCGLITGVWEEDEE